VTRAAWAVWQAGLAMPFTLPDDLPPLRLLLVVCEELERCCLARV
jgi:hypothetical protein